jgi:hypothetical protein
MQKDDAFKHLYSMARKAPIYQGLTPKELNLYRAAWREGYRSAAGKKVKPPLKIVYVKTDPDMPVLNNSAVVLSIFNNVLNHFKISKDKIIGKGRYEYLVIPRSMIANLIRDCSTLSYPRIAQIMNRDHTTIIHYIDSKFKQTSIWKNDDNKLIYGNLKGKVLRETRKQ